MEGDSLHFQNQRTCRCRRRAWARRRRAASRAAWAGGRSGPSSRAAHSMLGWSDPVRLSVPAIVTRRIGRGGRGARTVPDLSLPKNEVMAAMADYVGGRVQRSGGGARFGRCGQTCSSERLCGGLSDGGKGAVQSTPWQVGRIPRQTADESVYMGDGDMTVDGNGDIPKGWLRRAAAWRLRIPRATCLRFEGTEPGTWKCADQ
jgi:hypothetical protein